jgi:uncharacterized membrane protein YphA (DoxX/SURF4 family)
MDSLFPELFFLSFSALMVLRIGAAIAFALLARNLYAHRREIATTSFPFFGQPSMTLVQIKVGMLAAIAILFTIGLWTQAAAIVGFVAVTKYWFFTKRYPAALPHGQLAYFLLALICLTLLVSGAGGWAFDLPY